MQIILHGWTQIEQGRKTEGVSRIEEGLSSWRTLGAELLRPYYLSLLAQGYARKGQVSEGLQILDEALAGVQNSAEGTGGRRSCIDSKENLLQLRE
jgi:predicted ATPase